MKPKKKSNQLQQDPFNPDGFDIFRGLDVDALISGDNPKDTKFQNNTTNGSPPDMSNAEPLDTATSSLKTLQTSNNLQKNNNLSKITALKHSKKTIKSLPDGKPIDMSNGKGLDSINVLQSPMSNGEPPDMANRLPSEGFKDPVQQIILTPFQFAVYNAIKQLKGRATTQKNISALSNVTYRTTRDIIKYMKNRGMFSVYEIIRNSTFQGAKIVVNPNMKILLNHPITPTKLPFPMSNGEQLDISNGERSDMPNGLPPNMSNAEQSSSSYIYNKKATTKNQSLDIINGEQCAIKTSHENKDNLNIQNIQKIIDENFEFGYWRQKGLRAKQIKHWTEISGVSLENMVTYLCYCKYEMVEEGLEESKQIKNVFNWFFRILEKTGHYPKPKTYKSHEEKQLEQEQELINQKKQEAKKAEDLYREKIEIEQTKLFWEMMNNPEGEVYKKCFASLNSFQKGLKKHGKVFEMGMRDAFDKLVD